MSAADTPHAAAPAAETQLLACSDVEMTHTTMQAYNSAFAVIASIVALLQLWTLDNAAVKLTVHNI
jgi:hypothetical protein